MALMLMMAACTPKVGSERWCAQMEEKPKGDWTMNQAQDYAKHCLFESDDQTQDE